MIHFVVAFALLLHVCFWGAGLAMISMPRPWRRFWPVLVVPAGLALQSAIVWYGAHAGLPGTKSYAWWSEIVPAALLVVALWRPDSRSRAGRQEDGGPFRARRDFAGSARAAATDVSRFGVVWATVGGCLVLLLLPVAIASKGLTTISLGSCDAADYAAGARVLTEFARGDRAGFLGLAEVVRVHSVDNFFDYWLRLNHFTPSALIALNGVVLDCAPHELTTILAAVLLAGALPVVFWVSRAVIGYSGGVSVIIAGVFGVSPITWYAFAHAALGQLVAAQAIALLTWAGVALWRGRVSRQRGAHFAGVLALGGWLVLGSYNFFVLVCLVPAMAYAGGLALWQRRWRRFAMWLAIVVTPVIVCGALFSGRVVGLTERFTLLQTYDFGWQIPALTAEGWLGMVQGPDLEAWRNFGLRWILSAFVVGVLGWALLRAAQQRQHAVWLVVALSVPVLATYVFLQARGAQLGTNASYDAYKLFAVFYPLLLPAFCWWVTLRRSRRLHEWFFVLGVAAVIVAFNLTACGMFVWKLTRPPLIVDGELRRLREIELMTDVKSVNLLVPDMWSRLWANAFLLRKEQYFLTHTYEGRRNTPLRGDWDLEGGVVKVNLPGAGRRQITPRFALVDTRHPAFVRAFVDESVDRNWHAIEHSYGTTERWRWTGGDATLQLENPHAYPVAIDGRLEAWSPVDRQVTLTRLGGEPRPPVWVRGKRAIVRLPELGVPPERSTLVLQTNPPAAPVAGDSRPLGICVFRLTITPRLE